MHIEPRTLSGSLTGRFSVRFRAPRFCLCCSIKAARRETRGFSSVCPSTKASIESELGGALKGGAVMTNCREDGHGSENVGGVKGVEIKWRCRASMYNKGGGGGSQAARKQRDMTSICNRTQRSERELDSGRETGTVIYESESQKERDEEQNSTEIRERNIKILGPPTAAHALKGE